SSFEAYGREMDPQFEYLFTDLRKTHNQGVFDVYSPEMMRCRKSGVLTGLPAGSGRGRIIGAYRRVALIGIRYRVRARDLQFADLPGSAGARVISTESSRVTCAVIPTNEEKMIALDALRLGKVAPAA
ncbi:pyruvate formate lyase family protein, partial [Enterobacter sp. IF2SW-B1]|uniref:pyruvate formate lyase family protein n=1 Tax=Enterobacter sp. IF2SW-B1 TaxID=1841143 RepID=UPI000AA56BEB